MKFPQYLEQILQKTMMESINEKTFQQCKNMFCSGPMKRERNWFNPKILYPQFLMRIETILLLFQKEARAIR